MCIKCGNPDLVHDFGVAVETSDPSPSADSFSATSGTSSSGLTAGGLAATVAQPAPGPSVIEVADAAANTATGYTIGVGQTAQGTIATLGDHDWYRVNLVAGQTYSFAEIGTGTNSLQDTYLYLHNAGGTVVASDDDSGPGISSFFTYTPTVSGTYYVDAAAYTDPSTGQTTTGQYGISVTQGTIPNFDIPMGAGAVDSYYSWNATAGTPATVTYGFRQSLTYSVTGGSNSTVQLSAAEMAAVQQALQLWSDVSGVTFVQVNPGGYTNNATILIGNYQANDGAGAYTYYPGSTAASSADGDLWLNLNSISTSSVPAGSYSFFAIMHELGHAIGLSHPGDYNAGVNQTITYANSAQFAQDSEQYSVMSYFDGSYTGETPGGFATAYTPMMFDIYELQQIYGVNTTTRVGDTTYGFNSTAGSLYSFSAGSMSQYCIWDAGGNDTLDCSGYSQNQLINLNDGTFSNVGGGTGNISIAIGATIESAIGGSGADTLIANGSGSTLDGEAGNDTLICGAGVDTIIFRTGSGADTVTGFTTGNGGDKIDLTAFTSVLNLADVLGHTTQVGANTVINFGGNDSVTLQNVSRTSLTSDNFLFAPGGTPTDAILIDDVTITEGDSGTQTATFTVTRIGGTTAFSVDYQIADGTATVADSDYSVTAATGTLNFVDGQNTQTVTVTINGDTNVEPNENFFVNLSNLLNPTDAAVIVDAQAQGTITADDGPDLVVASITPAALSVVQGATLDFSYLVQNIGNTVAVGNPLDFSNHYSGVMIDQLPDDTHYYISDTFGPLDPGATATSFGSIDTSGLSVGQHTLYIMEDFLGNVAESDETNNVTAVTFNVTAPPSFVSISDFSITEGNSGTKLETFTVTRTGGSEAFTIHYATANGTATAAGNDYVAKSGTLSFGAGVNTQTVSITIKGDTTIEPNETFFVNLDSATSVSNSVSISDAQGVGTILNDDGAGAVSISDVSTIEGNGTHTVTFTVTRTGGNGSAFSVHYATANGTATTADHDYLATSGTLSFAAGVMSKTISVVIVGDTKIEPDQTFFVNLFSANNGAKIIDSQGVGTIINDDGTPVIHAPSGLTAADSSPGTSTPVSLFQGFDTSHDRDFVWSDRTDGTRDWWHDGHEQTGSTHDVWHNDPEPDHSTVDDLQALISRSEDAAHQSQDTLTHWTPPAVSQSIDRVEHVFHFDLH